MRAPRPVKGRNPAAPNKIPATWPIKKDPVRAARVEARQFGARTARPVREDARGLLDHSKSDRPMRKLGRRAIRRANYRVAECSVFGRRRNIDGDKL